MEVEVEGSLMVEWLELGAVKPGTLQEEEPCWHTPARWRRRNLRAHGREGQLHISLRSY